MIIKVRTKVAFEAEYPLDSEFYETDEEAELFAKEEALIGKDPVSFVELIERKGGKITITVNKVKE